MLFFADTLKGTHAAFLMYDVANLTPASWPMVGYFAQSFYHRSLLPLLLLTFVLAWFAKPSTKEVIPAGFRRFQFNYLLAWCFCVGADWLQGPYVYALYDGYGYSSKEIAQLFVAGFGSSMVFGCFVGSFADQFGRKKTCIAYCLFYIFSCLTKHFNSYWILMLGRITGGIATSMLFSGFECWMVSEHTVRNRFSSALLSYMFGLMFTTMYFVAIATGFAAQAVVDNVKFAPIAEGSMVYVGGYLGPFDLSIACLVAGLVVIVTLWEENYGQRAAANTAGGVGGDGLLQTISEAGRLLLADARIALMGVVVACFEGAMYAFVFNWTPALDSKIIPPPHGLIFAAFMMACMCGASATTIVSTALRPAVRLALTFVLGILAFTTAASSAGSEALLMLRFACFLVFEFCVGVYMPAVGMVKSEVVPEQVRTTVYNMYRVPLNAVVVGLLLTDISMVTCFRLCALLLLTGCLGLAGIAHSKKPAPAGPSPAVLEGPSSAADAADRKEHV